MTTQASFIERTFSTRDALHAEAKAMLRGEIGDLDDARILLLSGGGTPMPLYDAIAHCPVPAKGELHVVLTDERHVPVDAPESNYGRMRPMFEAIGLPETRVTRIEPDVPLEEAAARYAAALNALFARIPTIHLGLFGVGPDGHTCSLFSMEDLETPPGLPAKATVRAVPPHRITLTVASLARVERAVVLLTGPEKQDIARKLIECPEKIVAGRALSHCAATELWRSP